MKMINKLLSILLIFAGIPAFDIKAATKSTESKVEKTEIEEKKAEEKKGELSPERQEANKLLLKSIRLGDFVMVKQALERGADVNNTITHEMGWTPLMLAAIRQHPYIAKLLLEHKADINKVGVGRDQDFSPLILALSQDMNNNTELIKLLLDHGADVNYQMPSKGKVRGTDDRALRWFINPETLKLLLRYGAIPDDWDLERFEENPEYKKAYAEFLSEGKRS